MSGAFPPWLRWARETKGPVTRADMADVERYARGRLLVRSCQRRGPNAEATNAPLRTRWPKLTGIDQAVSRRTGRALRCGPNSAANSTGRTARVRGRYDASGLGLRSQSGFQLLSFRTIRPANPLVGATVQRRGRSHDAQAELATGTAPTSCLVMRSGRPGIFGPRPQSPRIDFPAAADSCTRPETENCWWRMACFDLATPYFGSKILLDQLPGLRVA